MNIRNAVSTESTLVLGVLLAAYRTWADFIDDALLPRNSIQQIEQRIQAGNTIIIEMDEAIVGCAQFDVGDVVATMHRLAIHPIHQRHHLGSSLLKIVESVAATANCQSIELRTPSLYTAANKFLLRHCYQAVAEIGSMTLYRKTLKPQSPAETIVYERTGACLRSGKCCSRIFLRYADGFLMHSDLERLSADELQNLNDFTKTAGVHYLGTLADGTAYFQCNQLLIDSDGIASCAIYDQPNRPETCALFPVSPSAYRYRTCGYRFIALPSKVPEK